MIDLDHLIRLMNEIVQTFVKKTVLFLLIIMRDGIKEYDLRQKKWY
jgi:hypothetical protein